MSFPSFHPLNDQTTNKFRPSISISHPMEEFAIIGHVEEEEEVAISRDGLDISLIMFADASD